MRKRVKGLLADLRDQSQVFETQHHPIARRKASLAFDVHLHGALDLFTGSGCQNLRCRLEAAQRLARSLGLIADGLWLTDTFSSRFADFGRVTNAKLDLVIDDALVLAQIAPLIKAGIVRFQSPWSTLCRPCFISFEKRLDELMQAVIRTWRSGIRLVKKADGTYSIDTGRCFEPGVVLTTSLSQRGLASDLVREMLTDDLRALLWIAREASASGGAVASNSRSGLSGLLEGEKRLHDKRTLLVLEKDREFSIPWVDQLTAAQIIELRQEAATALPVLREKLARAMRATPLESQATSSPSDIVAELREQAAEVKTELEAKQRTSARFWKVAFGLLGLGFAAYGFANDQPGLGVAGLLPVIQLLVAHKTGLEADVAKLKARPGYVLVKAQDILRHSE